MHLLLVFPHSPLFVAREYRAACLDRCAVHRAWGLVFSVLWWQVGEQDLGWHQQEAAVLGRRPAQVHGTCCLFPYLEFILWFWDHTQECFFRLQDELFRGFFSSSTGPNIPWIFLKAALQESIPGKINLPHCYSGLSVGGILLFFHRAANHCMGLCSSFSSSLLFGKD